MSPSLQVLDLRPSGWIHWKTTCPLSGGSPLVGLHILRSTLSSVTEAFATATTLLFSLIVFSLSAALISVTGSAFYFTFSGIALATSLLTLLTVGPMCDQIFWVVACRFFVDLYRKGSYFSWIVVEVSDLCKPFFLFPLPESYKLIVTSVPLDPLVVKCIFRCREESSI